jgi:integrase/recombinase XerC
LSKVPRTHQFLVKLTVHTNKINPARAAAEAAEEAKKSEVDKSALRVPEPRRLPRGLDRKETTALLGSLRTEWDRAIAGLMLLSGLRSAEVLGLTVLDVDIGRGWVRVIGKGDKERRVRWTRTWPG